LFGAAGVAVAAEAVGNEKSTTSNRTDACPRFRTLVWFPIRASNREGLFMV
jgi:hypothetical protein